MSETTAIVWLRNDLRVTDNQALHAAIQQFDRVIPLYILPSEGEDKHPLGAASRVWLHHSLKALADLLQSRGSRLIIRTGEPDKELVKAAQEAKASAILWNRSYEPAQTSLEKKISKALEGLGCSVDSYPGNLLLEPWQSVKKDGTPYLVYTPFSKSCFEKLKAVRIESAPPKLPTVPSNLKSADLSELNLLPEIPWDKSIAAAWEIGEPAAQRALKAFIKNGVHTYTETRNLPALKNGVSRLSPHLHFGEISPRQVWLSVQKELANLEGAAAESAVTFLKELLWREFSYHLLFHFPTLPDKGLRTEFDRFPWEAGNKHLTAWQKGLTGYPIVDAGMRQLWQTGWMHNRVRMIVGSFLIKDLNIDWRTGEEWFWDTLVDADLAQNAMNWQWVAGCGPDASPFFRIFNPTGQGKKFDPEGGYVRRWVPELADLPNKWIHAPHEAPAEVLEQAKVKLGDTYPLPVVDHAKARAEALSNYKRLR